MLRALARELEARGIVSRISYETVRRVPRCYPPVPPETDFRAPARPPA